MTAAEKVVLTNGIMALAFAPGTVLPADAVPGAGYVPGVPRLNIPALKESDASLGVAWVGKAIMDAVVALLAAPFTFVGMVRHSFLRQDASLVDVQVNLVDKGERKEQSHAIATRLRPAQAASGQSTISG